MAETNTTNVVVASGEPASSEAATGSPLPATTKTVTLPSRSPSPESTAVTSPSPPATTTTETPLSSRSPSPATPEVITVEPTVAAERESLIDPRVVALRAMFPDYDDVILQSVLESVDWNQDPAVDTLLIMSDPDYKPEPLPPQRPQRRHTAPVLSQEQLDEQFARQLLIQEEQQMSQYTAGRLQGPGPPGTYPAWGHPGRPGGPQQQPAHYPQQQTGQGQSGGEFQEQINKFAETGKKTIGNFLTKVKTKFQEFEQGRASGPPATQYPSQQWTPGPASYYGPPQPNQPPQGFQYAGQSSPTSAPLPASQPSTYQPINQDPTSVTTSTPRAQTGAVPPLASPAPPIDGGKLGLLPKRPVSLIRDDNPTVAGKSNTADASGSAITPPGTTAKGYAVDDDDDDGLEYAESPFDEPAHKK